MDMPSKFCVFQIERWLCIHPRKEESDIQFGDALWKVERYINMKLPAWVIQTVETEYLILVVYQIRCLFVLSQNVNTQKYQTCVVSLSSDNTYIRDHLFVLGYLFGPLFLSNRMHFH
jgi:hypothetical protein